MDIETYKIIITPTASKEIYDIYYYIFINLDARKAARQLMRLVEKEINNLKYFPKIHHEIEVNSGVKRKYRRIVIKRYVILYTIDENKKIIYISRMYYGLKNYLNNGKSSN